MGDNAIWDASEKRFRRSVRSWGSSKRRSEAKALLNEGFENVVSERLKNPKPHTFALSVLRSVDPKKKPRPICVPSVPDFAIQCWMYEKLYCSSKVSFPNTTYGVHFIDSRGNREVRGCHRCIKDILSTKKNGFRHGFETDLIGFFPSIDRDKLKSAIEKHLGPTWVDMLQPVIHFTTPSDEYKNSAEFSTYFNGKGVAQGGVLSPLMANLLLLDLDSSASRLGSKVFRYVDDLVLLSRTAKQRDDDAKQLCQWISDLNLEYHDPSTENSKTKTFGLKGEFRFLGFEIRDKECMPIHKARDLLITKLEELAKKDLSSFEVLTKANSCVLGWYLYFGVLWEGPRSNACKGELQNRINKTLSLVLGSRNLSGISEKFIANLGVAQLASVSKSKSFTRLRSKFPLELQLKLIEDFEFCDFQNIEPQIVQRI